MIDIAELEQYFPQVNKPIKEGPYTFTVTLSQDTEEDIFVVNLKIKQADNKEDHLIKFRMGIGKDKESDSGTHKSHKPHFELDIYRREKDSFSATVYFTFDEANDTIIMKYAKGTVVIINNIITLFCTNHQLGKELVEKIIYGEAVADDLSEFEPVLIEALYRCYKGSDLVVRQDGEAIVVKTEHNLKKYLNVPDLKPLYLPLLKKIKSNKDN